MFSIFLKSFYTHGIFFFWFCAFPFLPLNLLTALPNLYPIFWIVLSTSSRDCLIKIWFPVFSMFQASVWKRTSFNELLSVVFLAFLCGINFKCSSVFYFFFSTETDFNWGIGNAISLTSYRFILSWSLELCETPTVFYKRLIERVTFFPCRALVLFKLFPKLFLQFCTYFLF